MIKTGIHSKCFGASGILDVFRLSRSLGFTQVDVNAADIGESAQVDQMLIADKPEPMAELIRKQADLYGVELQELYLCPVAVDGVRVEVNNPDKELRAKLLANFERLCLYGAAAGFKSIMGVPGTVVPGVDEHESWQLSVELLNRMVETAARYKIAFHVEPHFGSIIIESDKGVQLAKEVPGLRYTLDYCHFIMAGIPQREADKLIPYAGHMHARQTVKGKMASPLGEGVIDFAAVIAALKQADWDGIISLEYGGASKDVLHLTSVFQNVALAYELEMLINGR